MYDDDDGDEDASVGGFDPYNPNPNLYARAMPAWARRLKVDRDKPRTTTAPSNIVGQDEVRWGDTRTRNLIVPSGGVGNFGETQSFEQIVQIERGARVWDILLATEHVNAVQTPGVAGEEILSFFSLWLGVGASRIRISQNIVLPLPSTPIFTEFGVDAYAVLRDMPAASIVIAIQVMMLIPAPVVGDRTFTVKMSAQASPVCR